MKILHLTDGIPPVSLGGTGGIVRELAREQQTRGHSVAILSAAKSGALPEQIDQVHLFRMEPLPKRWAHYRCIFSVRREREILAAIDACEPDLVHAHTVSRQCGYRWMTGLRKRGIGLVITCHDVSHVAYGKVTGSEKHMWLRDMLRYKWSWNPLRHAMIRKFLRSADRILTVSDALKEYLETRGLRNLETLHNGIDLGFWKPLVSKADARRQLKLPSDRFLFLLAGRMGVDKGSLLIAATLPKGADLVLAGDRFSDEFAPVKDRMHVFYHQSSEEMKLHYSAADAVLVPSKCVDCFPTVCLEAMAMERPVLATSLGGSRESVEHGRTGWIIDPFDEPAWRERMAWCVSHTKELLEAGRQGRKRIEEQFTIRHMADALENIYAEVQNRE